MENSSQPQSSNDNLKASLAEKITSTCLNSTSHGVPNIIRTEHKSIKLLWIILILISIGFCSYFTINGILEYLQFQTSSSLSAKSEPSIELPALTLCLTTFFGKRDASHKIIYNFIERKTGKKITNLSDYISFIKYYDALALMSLSNELQQNMNLFNETVKRSIGFNKSEFVLECVFNTDLCNISSIVWYFSPLFGMI
jgi:hypothetical protein